MSPRKPKEPQRWLAENIERTRGGRIRQRRKLLGLSQAQLTSLLPEVTEGNANVIGRIESGEVRCFDSRAVVIAQLLRVPIAWLYMTEEWTNVRRKDDPFLDEKKMFSQILGEKKVARMVDAMGEDREASRDILLLMTKNEIMKRGVRHHAGARTNGYSRPSVTA